MGVKEYESDSEKNRGREGGRIEVIHCRYMYMESLCMYMYMYMYVRVCTYCMCIH